MLVTDKKNVIWFVRSHSVSVVCRGWALNRQAEFHIGSAESIVLLLQLTRWVRLRAAEGIVPVPTFFSGVFPVFYTFGVTVHQEGAQPVQVMIQHALRSKLRRGIAIPVDQLFEWPSVAQSDIFLWITHGYRAAR